MREKTRALIIGSGFGGAIAAYRLAKAGVQTVVLERGKRWDTSAREDAFCTYRNPDGRAAWLSEETVLFEPKPIPKHVGIVERLVENGITVWAAAGVGGGSLVYNSVLLQPTKDDFYKCFPAEVNYDELNNTYFPRVLEMLGAGPIPDDVLNSEYYLSSRILLEQAAKAGLSTMRLNIGSDWDVVRKEIHGTVPAAAIAGEIWYGINSGCKNSVDKNYLHLAETQGAEVAALHVVTDIHEADGGYCVSYERIEEDGTVAERGKISCDYLFMGAGSMGTSKLLTRAKAKKTLPKLNDEIGRHWGNNGDTFAVHAVNRPTNGAQGGPASVAIRHLDNPQGTQTLIIFPEWDSPDATLTLLGMGIPQDTGEFRYDTKTDSVALHWPTETSGGRTLLDRANHTLGLLDKARDDKPAAAALEPFQGHYQCAINARPNAGPAKAQEKTTASSGVTAHLLGGAVLGKACDLYGRVVGYSGLYVVDGALIPRAAAACNPALTIAAFAERCMDKILAEDIRT